MPKIGISCNRIQSCQTEPGAQLKDSTHPKNLDDFATPEQLHALETNNLHTLEIANDQALALALQASLAQQGGTAQPKTASLIVKALIEEDGALAAAIQASETGSMPSGIAATTSERLKAQSAISSKLQTWFSDHGYQVVPNKGRSNNCLLISLLQHATGDYTSEHHQKASHYKSMLAKESGFDIHRRDPLYFDTPLISNLVYRIGKDHGRDISVNFCFADADGNYADHTVGSGKNPVMIFDKGGHYEAVLPPSQNT